MEMESTAQPESTASTESSAASESQAPTTAESSPQQASPQKLKEVATGLEGLNAKIKARKEEATKSAPTTVVADKAATEPTETPAYKPDLKYKAAGVEKEIPELFRGLLKDKKAEEEIKELLTRAHGQEETKAKNEQLTQSVQQMAPKLQNFEQGLNKLRQLWHRGDIDGWLNELGVKKESIYKWVLDEANYSQLPPEQKAMVDARRNAERQSWQAQDSAGVVSQRERELASQLKAAQLDSCLGKPDVKAMQDAFDARVGTPGAFRNAVASHGEAVWLRTNGQTDLTPEQAIQDFVRWYGDPSKFAQAPQAQPASAAPAATTAPAPKVNVIPRVDGKSLSPLQSKVKSIDDIKKRAKELAAQKRDNYSA
jgi:hypothetical protein